MWQRFVLCGIAVGLACLSTAAVLQVQAWRDPSALTGGPAKPVSADQQASPDHVVWQPAVEPGPHPLLADADQSILVDGGRLPVAPDPKHASLVRTLLKDRPSVGQAAPLRIDYPMDESVFPSDFVAPTFQWHESAADADTWLIDVEFAGQSLRIHALSPGRPPKADEIDPQCVDPSNEIYRPSAYEAAARSWRPGAEVWAAIKDASVEKQAVVTIFGFNSDQPDRLLSCGRMTLKTSRDPVDAPIFYRDVPLMPAKGEDGVIRPLATKALPLVRWRLRDVSLEESRVVMEDMPTCANCHSFSRDGQTLGIDVDGPQGDKGAYAMVPIAQEMSIAPENVITWNSFPDKPPEQKTIGFMSRVSPDGQYVVTTVNESVFVANFTDHKFLQVFYPTRGILAIYSQKTGEIRALPGADDPEYVHCSPTWTPDGKTIIFARAKARDPYDEGAPMPKRAGDPAEVPIRYDLCRIPLRDGQGGVCEPIVGASNNGMSNTFPKVSPDGRWIVSTRCKNGMLMRPDGELWIVPVTGGEARRMRCNTRRMNSWHSFSPNGRWMVFATKANTPYTQMMLTHLDETGDDSPPILIPHSTAGNRAVNLPEFVNIDYDDQMQAIAAPAIEPFRHFASGQERAEAGLHLEAVAQFKQALQGEPDDWRIHMKMAESLTKLGDWTTAQIHLRKALARRPNLAPLQYQMAQALIRAKDYRAARVHLDAVIQLSPESVAAWCNRATIRRQLGDLQGALADYDAALRLDPKLTAAWYNRGFLRMQQEDWTGAVEDFERFLELSPPSEPHLARVEATLGNLRSQIQR